MCSKADLLRRGKAQDPRELNEKLQFRRGPTPTRTPALADPSIDRSLNSERYKFSDIVSFQYTERGATLLLAAPKH